jgi:hypothetical protein
MLGAPPSRPTPLPTPTPAPAPRTAPPAAPPSRAKAASIPPPLAQPELEVDDAAMLDEAVYENEGADFALNFAGEAQGEAESTAIGSPPQRDSMTTDPVGVPAGRGRRRGNEDW